MKMTMRTRPTACAFTASAPLLPHYPSTSTAIARSPPQHASHPIVCSSSFTSHAAGDALTSGGTFINRRAASLFLSHTPSRSAANRNGAAVRMGLFDLWQKEDPNAPPKFGFRVGYSYLAHPEKDTGEDAFFIEGTSIGVFDGVSGASETRGVDPRLYSQRLAAETCRLAKQYGPASVTKAAIEASLANDEIGASTACVVGMDRVGRLFGINLGDSGVRLIRGEKMVFRTKEQQHFFNCPYQLGTDSEDGMAMGQNIQQKVQEGDVIIVASDGLYDNMNDKEIVTMVNSEDDPMALAEKLGTTASVRGMDKSFTSPFMLAAEQAGVKWKGGKADDVTIVAVKIVDGSEGVNESLLSTIPEAEAAA